MNWEIIYIAVLMLFLAHRFFDLKNLLNPFVFFYLYQTFFCFIALSYNEALYPRIGIDADLKQYIILAYLLTFLGAFLSRTLFARAGITYVRINEIYVQKRPTQKFRLGGFLIFGIGILAFLIFTYKTGGIILFSDDLENERITRKAGAGLVNLIFVSFLLYGFGALLLSVSRSFLFKISLFLFVSFALISYGSRAPLLKLIITAYLLITILSKKKISFKQLAKILIVLFAILAAFEAYRSNVDSDVGFLKLSALRLSWRPFVNIQNLQKNL